MMCSLHLVEAASASVLRRPRRRIIKLGVIAGILWFWKGASSRGLWRTMPPISRFKRMKQKDRAKEPLKLSKVGS